MSVNKLFLRFITIFGLTMMFTVPGWGANVDLTLTFSDTPDPVVAGNQLTYNVNVANSNLNRADDIIVTIPLPAGTTYISGCSLSGSNVVCNFGSINKNTNDTLSFIVAPSAAGTLSATATVTTSDTNQNNTKSSTIQTTVVADTPYRCANPRAFTSQASISLYGNSRIIGNTNMCYNNGGVCSNPGNARNNGINMMYSDPDGGTDTTTFNASSARLDIPDGSSIRWAKLYWQGYLVGENDATKGESKSVKFYQPNGSVTTIDSARSNYDYNWIYFTGDRYYYQGSADVTNLVQAAGEGNYTVANIVSELGTPIGGSYGAWALAIIYDDPNESFKNVTVFDGYQGIVPSGDQTSASAHAAANACSAETGARNTMTMPLTGFLTPKTGAVTSSLSIFAGEGDKGATGDHMSLTDSSGTAHYVSNALNPWDDIFNSTITYNGATVTNTTTPVSITPWYSANSLGIDIDTFDVSTIIGNNQSSTNVTLDTNGDGYMPGVFVFSTELYVPKFCYDYGYEQNGRPFTEENNGTIMPRISGYLPNTEDINVSIYLRNQENSDVSANNVMFNIHDINASQVIYKRNSVAVTYPNEFTPTHKNDSAWPLNVSDTYIRNIPLNNMAGKEYAYIYYGLSPQSMGDINTSIVGTFSYDLVLPLPDGTSLTLPYTSQIGGVGLPMCSSENFSYTPEWGIFSVVDAGLYNAANVNRYYDLTTQVVKRPGNFRVASFDPAALDTPKPVTTIVAVELIDASQFHDVDAACREPSSAISPRVWVAFDNNVSQVNFNATTIQNAITGKMVSDVITRKPSTITSAAQFYQTATPNAAFRVSFNTLADQNDSLIQIEKTTQGIRISNFSDIHKVYPHCRQFVTNPQNNNMTDQTSVACSNKGNNSTYEDVAICMECLYGAQTQVLCSRDNFAIRPESFTVVLKDFNQTTGTGDIGFTGITGNVDRTDREDIASGYQYRFDINATNHIDNRATLGYSRYFATGGSDYNISLIWEPTVTKTGCNDTNSSRQNFNLIHGTVTSSEKHYQIGEYRLNIIDKTWTAVDWNPAFQGHQVGSHFLSGAECEPDSTIVPVQATVIGLVGTTLTNRVGCDISSTHTKANGMQYLDHLITVHPYRFDMSGISFGVGTVPSVIESGGGGFVYMSDISREDSLDMSMRSTGNIRAVGYDNLVTTNFVDNCYAKPLNFSMRSGNNLTHSNGAAYQMRFMDFNSSGMAQANLIHDSGVIDLNTSTTLIPLTKISDGNFTKDTAGSLPTISRFNYARTVTQALNPFVGQFSDLDIECVIGANCMMQADLIATHQAIGNRAMDFNVTHAYGRIIPRDVRVFGNVDFTANAWYEVFNAPTLMGTALPASRNEALWYVNTQHNDLNYGDGNVTVIVPNDPLNLPIHSSSVLGVETYMFNGTAPIYSGKAHINTDPWLWYGINALDYGDPSVLNLDCQTHPCFNINVVPSVGATGSAKSTNKATKESKKSDSGGGEWKSTSDYAPAIR
jgi:uncharacterized repeat protein (TIGR01451 family)